jgi:class 3 adenylate cyclase
MAAAADVILGEEGTVDKFLGDAVMAWFNAPIRQPDHTLRAVRAGIAIRDATRRLHKDLPQDLQLMFGVGIHTGIAVLGMVGTEKRLDYTAIGDSVNTSRRIQENALPGQILVSQDVVNKIANAVQIKPVEPILAKGKRDPIPVFEVLSLI